jgi:nucleotide-binding universal stress UspA family protein
MFKHILLATDGSPASQQAAVLAVGLARTHGAELTVLYVVDPSPYLGVGEANPLGFQAYMSAALQHAARAHSDVVDLAATEPRVHLHTRLAQDVEASAGIIGNAKDMGADLIVVGSHGRTGLKRLMLGSVSGRVVAESPIPVLVAR